VTVELAGSGGWNELHFHCDRPSDEIVGARREDMVFSDSWMRLPADCVLWLFHVENTHFRVLRCKHFNESSSCSSDLASACTGVLQTDALLSSDDVSTSNERSASSDCAPLSSAEESDKTGSAADAISADSHCLHMQLTESSRSDRAEEPCENAHTVPQRATKTQKVELKTEAVFEWSDGKCGSVACLQSWGHSGCCDSDIRTGSRRRSVLPQ